MGKNGDVIGLRDDLCIIISNFKVSEEMKLLISCRFIDYIYII